MIRKEEIIKASVAYNERNGKLNVFGGSNILSNEEYFAFNKNPDFIAGAEWSDENPDGKMLLHVLGKGVEQGKRELIDKACKWLRKELVNFEDYSGMGEELISDFRKAMEE